MAKATQTPASPASELPASELPASELLAVNLPSGTLKLKIKSSLYAPKDLMDFAVRRNPKRGFLFVSKVLGKHIPISPSLAATTHKQLAAALPPLQNPHFIGLAETATALGEGVYHAYKDQNPQQHATYQHTTRYQTQHPLMLRFDEPHSHAPAHLLYDIGPIAANARELVLVDDEITTGTTLENLAREWVRLYPQLERVILVSLTDWCSRRTEIAQNLQRPVEFVSLLSGSYTFEPAADWQPPTLPPVIGKGDDKTALLPSIGPRFGQPRPTLDYSALIASLDLKAEDHILVLGTGEFQYSAFALAHQLEQHAAVHGVMQSVHWSATTRSPILSGLAIKHSFTFMDNYADEMPNFLYNIDPAQYSKIVVVYEGQCRPSPQLMEQLGARAKAIQLS